jgi:amino acid adenylation domain-containing protein
MNQELKDKIKGLKPDQIKELLAKAGKKRAGLPKMERNNEQRYPLSDAQKRIWFLSITDDQSSLYTNPMATRVQIPSIFDFEVWKQSFEEVVNRNEVMRTSFEEEDGQLYQRIHETINCEIVRKDLRESQNQEEDLNAIVEKDGKSLISVSDFPLFRHIIVELGDGDFVFVYTSHHIISDAWSSSRLFREVFTIYFQIIQTGQSLLAPPKYQFIDYVAWENSWKKSENYNKSLDTWKKIMLNKMDPIKLPLDFKRPEIIDSEGALLKCTIEQDLTDKLLQFSQSRNLNLFHTLFGCFQILLHKYSNQNRFSVGIPLANRETKEFQDIIGMFLNTLPFPADINPQQTVHDFFNEIRAVSEQIQIHQQFPFQGLVDELKPVRSTAIPPIFQVLFVFQNVPSLYDIEGMKLSPIRSDFGRSKYELNLWIEEVKDELQLSLTYQTKLFKKATAENFLERYIHLLEEVIASDTSNISQLQLEVTKDETLHFLSIQGTYLDQFNRQVNSTPSLIAANDYKEEFSYLHLDKLSNQIANCLLQSTRADVIGVQVERSVWQIALILGIHKAGKAYAPINEDWTLEDKQSAIEQLNLQLLITDDQNLQADCRIELLQSIRDTLSDYDADCRHITPSPEDLAYIIFTSGSTGKPKGVMVEHAQIRNYCDELWPRLSLGAGDGTALVSSLSVDLGYTQIFPSLCNGARVDIVDKGSITDPILLKKLFNRKPPSSLKIVPSHLLSLITHDKAEELLPEKTLILGGESIPTELIEKIRSLKQDLIILNHYGPTETTIGVCTQEIESIDKMDKIPIGKVLGNNTIRIENSNGESLPQGLVGEIVIYGSNVSRGYLQVFSDKFTQNSTGIRGYRTSDLGRFNFDGELEFLGRKDRQIKFKGHRVELEGIENIARKVYPSSDIVVLSKSNRLTLYISGQQEHEYEDRIKQKIPQFLQPLQFIYLDSIPRLGNGKVDFRKLSMHTPVQSKKKFDHFRPPKNETELKLIQIWKEVLKLNKIKPVDDFFELGGNSLSAIELISMVNRLFGTQLNVSSIFKANNIELMAELVKGSNNETTNRLISLRKGTGSNNLFIVHPAGGDVLVYNDLANSIDERFNIYGLQNLVGDTDHDSIELMAKTYLKEIDELKGDNTFMGWSMGALVAFEMALQTEQSKNIQIPVILLDQLAPIQKSKQSLSKAERLLVFAKKVEALVGQKFDFDFEEFIHISKDEQITLFLKEFVRFKMVPKSVTTEMFEAYLNKMILHNDITLLYQASSYNGRVLLIKAEESTFMDVNSQSSPSYGWINYCENLVCKNCSGNHVTMMRSPNVEMVGEIINEAVKNNEG